jgi:hypothetical protein
MSKYDDIKGGKDRPEVIDALRDYGHVVGMEHGPLHPFAREIMDVANQLDRQWREHMLEQYIRGLENIVEVYKEERDQARQMFCVHLSGKGQVKLIGFDRMTPQQIADHFNWYDSPQPKVKEDTDEE